MEHIRMRSVALISLALLACGAKLELPEAEPLSVPQEQLQSLPGFGPGPYAVRISPHLAWEHAEQSHVLRAVYPELSSLPAAAPLILFSHGFASDIDQYDALLRHWASHGAISLAIRHPDAGGTARGIWASIRLGKEGLIRSRMEELQALLQALQAPSATLPTPLKAVLAQADPGKVIAAGHSFGAFTAQQLGGAQAISPDGSLRIGLDEAPILGVVAISPPGEMFGWIQQASWTRMRVPTLSTTGTWDVDGRFVTDWRQHRLAFDTAPAEGRHQLLVIQGADHYLGNLICRTEREQPPQNDALRLVQSQSWAFIQQALGLPSPSAGQSLAEITAGFAWMEQR